MELPPLEDIGVIAVILLVLAIVLPFLYSVVWNRWTSKDVNLNNPNPNARSRIARIFADLRLRRRMLVENVSRACYNATSPNILTPFKVKEIYGGGPFFDIQVRNPDLESKVVVVCVVEGETVERTLENEIYNDDSEDEEQNQEGEGEGGEPKMNQRQQKEKSSFVEVPKKIDHYRFFEQHIVPLINDSLAGKYSSLKDAMPDLLQTACKNANLDPDQFKKVLPTYRLWFELVTWENCFNQPECDMEGNRIPKPWEAERIMNRILRFGTRGVSVAPCLTKHPDHYKVRKFNDAVDFHLLWSPDHLDILSNIRAAFDSYKTKKTA